MSRDQRSVGVLYVATGKYSRFWAPFFESAQSYFLEQSRKHYFLFTDDPELLSMQDKNVTSLYAEYREWPYSTLLRYELFESIADRLERFDFLCAFNANIVFVNSVCEPDFLPLGGRDNGLTGVLHPRFYRVHRWWRLPFERKQRASTAYTPWWTGRRYFIGAVTGGIGPNYIEMIRTISGNIRLDLDHRIIAVWHDESHLNAYFDRNHPKILTTAYGYPEGREHRYLPRILIRDKSLCGGHDYLRGG